MSLILLCLICLVKLESDEGNVIVTEGVYCWFADPRAYHFENAEGTIKNTYIGYIDSRGRIKAKQINHITNTVCEVLVRSYFQPDDHGNPCFLILPDGRVIIFYSRHNDEACFRYRISKKAYDIRTLGDEKMITVKASTSYPSLSFLSSDPNHIYLTWRSINSPTIGRLTLPDADDVMTLNWGPLEIIKSSGARPFTKYFSNGRDKIYLTYTTDHPDNDETVFIYFSYINIVDSYPEKITLTDVTGNRLSVIKDGTFSVSKTNDFISKFGPVIVDSSPFRNWIWEVGMDKNERPVIAMVSISSDQTSHDYFHAKWTGNEWKKTFLGNGGGHFHQTADVEKSYSGGMAIDISDSNSVYCSVPVVGCHGKVYEIIKYTISNDENTVTSISITKNSKKNNFRPYSIPNTQNSSLKLIWIHGDYYYWIVDKNHPGFSTDIHGDYRLPVLSVNLNENLRTSEDFDSSNDGSLSCTTDNTYTVITDDESTEFTIYLSPWISKSAYYGTIIEFGGVKYGLDKDSMNPMITIGDVIHYSRNKLATSDSWRELASGTGGGWYPPVELKYFSLIITYFDGVLITYINGLIDQYIEISELKLGSVKTCEFEGSIDDVKIYNRAINADEAMAIFHGYEYYSFFYFLFSLIIYI
jgi:hypothetical protein